MTSRTSILISLLASGLLLASCGQPRRGGGTACYDASECSSESGELEACVGGFCEAVGCLSSSDCPLDTVCDVEDFDYECEEGCHSNADCRDGKTCEDGQCEEYGCRSTLLDCGLREICDLETGECEEAEGPYCTECNLADNEWVLGETTACDDQLVGNDFCGGDGSYCMNLGTPVCLVSCEEQEDCPGGYVCQQVSWGLPPGCNPDYILLEKVCLSDCMPNN